jgi:hypothetical protein
MIVGDVTVKNGACAVASLCGLHSAETCLLCAGEKRLRSLLSKTTEWNSAREREAAAAACDGAEDGAVLASLAAALRVKSCASLRKQHLFHLCRAWGYASDQWRCKEAQRRAPRAPPAAFAVAETRVAPPLPPPAPFCSLPVLHAHCAAQQYMTTQLRPLVLQSAVAFAGARAREAAASLGGAHITARSVARVTESGRWLQLLQLEWGRQHAALLHWSRRMAAPEGGTERDTVAWVALSAPQSRAVYRLDDTLADMVAMAQSSLAACAHAQQRPGCSAAEAAALEEMSAGVTLGLRLNTLLTSVLADAKFGTAAQFADVATAALELAMLSTSVVTAHLAERADWMRGTLGEAAAADESSMSGLSELPELLVPVAPSGMLLGPGVTAWISDAAYTDR